MYVWLSIQRFLTLCTILLWIILDFYWVSTSSNCPTIIRRCIRFVFYISWVAKTINSLHNYLARKLWKIQACHAPQTSACACSSTIAHHFAPGVSAGESVGFCSTSMRAAELLMWSIAFRIHSISEGHLRLNSCWTILFFPHLKSRRSLKKMI